MTNDEKNSLPMNAEMAKAHGVWVYEYRKVGV